MAWTPANSGQGAAVNTAAPVTRFDFFANKFQQIADRNNAWSAMQAHKQMAFQQGSADRAMAFNREEAQKNRDWQQYMSNTAHQREVKDLMSAGLNPVLSAMGGNGAPVTSGATASGYASEGAKASPDTSTSAALVGLLGSLLQAQTQIANTATSANAQLAVADKYNSMAKYTADLQAQTALSTTGINAMASRYAAAVHADATKVAAAMSSAATKYSAAQHAAAMRYGADQSFNATKYSAMVNKELKRMDIKAQFDFADQFPNNAWQSSPGQANARDWIGTITSGLRDLAIAGSSVAGAATKFK